MSDMNYIVYSHKILLMVAQFLMYWQDEIGEMPKHEVIEALYHHLQKDDGKVLEIMSPYI